MPAIPDLGGAPRLSRPELNPRAERLYTELDNRLISTVRGDCVIKVHGIHAVRDEVWIQAAPSDEPANSVVLHLSARATGAHAVAALTAWCATEPDDRPRVLDVMHLALSG